MDCLWELHGAIGGACPEAGIGSTLNVGAECLSGARAPASDWVGTADVVPEDLDLSDHWKVHGMDDRGIDSSDICTGGKSKNSMIDGIGVNGTYGMHMNSAGVKCRSFCAGRNCRETNSEFGPGIRNSDFGTGGTSKNRRSGGTDINGFATAGLHRHLCGRRRR